MRKILFLIFISIILTSCTNNSFETILFRTTEDPFFDVPDIDSLTLEHTICLSWKIDDACDTFYLMRSNDQKTLDFSCVYEGTDLEYIDTKIADNNRYIYRLDKKRGNKYFTGKEYAYGFSIDCRRDSSESNDIQEEATFLEYDLSCNLPCIRFITNNKQIIDTDWFYIEVPARRSAEILINQSHLANSSTNAPTNLNIQIVGSTSSPVRQKSGIVIQNFSYNKQIYYFNIYPETTGLLSQDSNTAIIEYTISLNRIYNGF